MHYKHPSKKLKNSTKFSSRILSATQREASLPSKVQLNICDMVESLSSSVYSKGNWLFNIPCCMPKKPHSFAAGMRPWRIFNSSSKYYAKRNLTQRRILQKKLVLNRS